MTQTISGSYASNVTLTGTPATITSAATISGTAASAIGVKGPSGTSWTLTNLGIVNESGGGGIGVSLASLSTLNVGGTVAGAPGGIISGAQDGVLMTAGGVVNTQVGGTITGIIGVSIAGAAATVTNAGSIAGNVTSGSAITLSAGGLVTNLAGGTLSGSYGVGAASVAATVVNAGSIGDGTSLPTGAAIALKKGGAITNQSGGQIIAGLQGIYGGGAVLTVVNAGSVGGSPTTGNGIIIAAGGVLTNQSGGVITGKYGFHALSVAATVSNYGSIGGAMTLAGASGVAIASGAVTNQAGGTITGLRGISATGATVVNSGSIGANTTTVTGIGVQLGGSGLANLTGGTITGFTAVYGKTAATTVVNSGSIGGNTLTGTGVRLSVGGTVTNQTGGTITGFNGVVTTSGVTVANAGSIGGTTAVSLGAGAANRLVVNPGGAFTGLVDGGNTIGAAFASTLELTSAASGGTISALGSQFVHFVSTMIDPGANWTISGSSTLLAGTTLTNAGTLTDIGTLLNGGTLTGNQINLNGGSLTNQAAGVLTASYVYGVAAGGADTFVNLGSITNAANAAIYMAASGQIINAAGATIIGFNNAVKFIGGIASVSNLGRLASTSGNGSQGVYIGSGGRVTNGQAGSGTGTASIEGSLGVVFRNAIGTVGNYGTIIGDGARAVDLGGAGGTLINGASGATAALLQALATGIYTGAGTVTNYATIIATAGTSQNYGVIVQNSGTITNLGSLALIQGHAGARIGANGTIINAGTIASNLGTAGVAVDFTGVNERLIDSPGAVFTGSIIGGSGGTSVLELTSAAGAGTITGLGTRVTNFTSLVFDSGARWTVGGNASALGQGSLGISGFDVGDTIDLTGFAAVGETFASNTLVLSDAGSAHVTLAVQGSFTSGSFALVTDGAGGTNIALQTAPVAPLIAGTSGGQAIADNMLALPFSGVSITDTNTGAQSESVTITLTNGGQPTDANGTLSGGGVTKTGTGIYQVSAASASAATTALDAVAFIPTADQVAPGGTVSTGFTLAVTDTLAQTGTDTATSVIATSVNDPPVIAGTVAGQAVSDIATISPFATTSISDPDPGASETMTITLTADVLPSDANGTLSGSGLSKTGIGVYTLAAGTPGAVTTALEAVRFTPTARQVSPGGTVTTAMTLSVTDGLAGSPTTDTTTSVVATAARITPCFASGTRIATPHGDVPVERLREGDILLTVSGKPRAIQWIGRRSVDCRRHPLPARVRPVRVAPHAFGQNRPSRALLLSPDHAVFIEDVLIPVKYLINDTTVTQLDVARVTYFHIELPSHDVVLAEGLPAETYLETGGRRAFENAGAAMQLHPDFAPDEARVGMVWRNFGFAPFADDAHLALVRGQLACQAAMLGYRPGDVVRPKKQARAAR